MVSQKRCSNIGIVSAQGTTRPIGAAAPISSDATFGLIKDYISLTKPKIISLLLISTCCPMVLASGGQVSLAKVIWALVGGALMTASASAINCIWDADIDALMERTKDRPMACGRVSVLGAFLFSILLGAIGLYVFFHFLNPLAAAISLGGHLFYVLVYTMWLKRTTPQNIVIGGAAGAVPPLVGWAAVTGDIGLDALLMFLVVFLWTPPHFWALALNRNKDYQRASVPMLPVVSGEKETHKQMLYYAIALLPVSLWLVYNNQYLGWFSFVVMGGAGVIFIQKILRMMSVFNKSPEVKEKATWGVFGFSLIYLAVFFMCMVVDAILI